MVQRQRQPHRLPFEKKRREENTQFDFSADVIVIHPSHFKDLNMQNRRDVGTFTVQLTHSSRQRRKLYFLKMVDFVDFKMDISESKVLLVVEKFNK